MEARGRSFDRLDDESLTPFVWAEDNSDGFDSFIECIEYYLEAGEDENTIAMRFFGLTYKIV